MQFNDDSRGFTLVEVTIILLVLVLLSAIMLPQMGNYNRLARYVKVKEDLGAICASVKKMLDEVMQGGVYLDPKPNGSNEYPVGLLIGPGDRPVDGAHGGSRWRSFDRQEIVVHTDYNDYPVDFVVDTLDNHLQQNNPGGGGSRRDRRGGGHGGGGHNGYGRYQNVFDNPVESGAFFGWRGPYFDKITPDPWGNRYAINSFGLHGPRYMDDPRDIFTSAVVCYSAGPNSGVDTGFNQPMNDADGDGYYGWYTGGDDIAVVLSAGGPF